MKILFLDCSRGISGDMLLASLFGAGLSFDDWCEEMGKLQLDPVPEFRLEEKKVSGMVALHFSVIEKGEPQKTRRFADMEKILRESGMSSGIVEKTLKALLRLAESEARIHGSSPDKVHFHEISGIDTIVDVCGAFVALEMMGVDKVVASPVNLGYGTIEFSHGKVSVPAPATAALIEGAPVFAGSEGEMTTPTGALLITELAGSFGQMPEMVLESMGAGTGARDYEEPGLVRAYIGSAEGHGHQCKRHGEGVFLLSTNLDDMEPRIAGYVMDRLLGAGVLDVYFEHVQMKKNRPGFVINVLCGKDTMEAAVDILMTETTTLGVRVQQMKRMCMERRNEEVETSDGPVRVKVGMWKGRIVRVNPEYDDCAEIAVKTGRPLASVMDEARNLALRKFPIDID